MMDASNAWNGHDPTLSAGPQDDFQQFLDMGMSNLGDGMNFDFQDFAGQHTGQMMQQDTADVMDTAMDGDVGMITGKEAMMQGQMPAMTSAAELSIMANTPLHLGSTSGSSMEALDAQIQFLQQRRQQQQQQLQLEQQQRQQQQQQRQQQQQQYFGQNRMVPPTPNSIEMHSANNQFYPQSDPQQQAMFERYQLRLKEQELAFTPLVSPAVTPLETHFTNIGEFTVPGAYFSPLSSPALHAQQEHRSAYESRLNSTSVTTSPIDITNIDLNAGTPCLGPSAKKTTRKAPPKPKSRSVRQSPIVKPQRRKAGGSTVISPQVLSDILEPPSQQSSQAQDKHLASVQSRSGASTTECSENDSVSPEQLSDMAPPPLPRSAKNSPYLMGQNGQSRLQQLNASMSPATPASLMRLAKSQQSSPSTNHNDPAPADDHPMDGFALPEPANPKRPSLSRVDTGPPSTSGQTTPTVESARNAAFALPSPVFTRPQSTKSSPQIRPQTGGGSAPSIPNTTSLRKTPQLAAKGSGPPSTGPAAKKRSSVSSSSILASPALRPRISPSIKPLIRGGASSISNGSISDDTASLLLASKSNYQNILEGTHLPGVSYPTELSTNLTSKRTSHKIAEQGRRNRINSALAEIATLLPKKSSGSGDSGKEGTPKAGEKDGVDGDDDDGKDGKDSKDGSKGGQSANSKASTVEQAIEYIKQLKKEVEDATRRAEEAEKKLSAATS